MAFTAIVYFAIRGFDKPPEVNANSSTEAMSSTRRQSDRQHELSIHGRLSVDQLFAEWAEVDRHSIVAIQNLAQKTMDHLSFSDDLVDLINRCRYEEIYFCGSIITDLEQQQLQSYDPLVVEKILNMSGDDTLKEYDSLWYKSYYCAAIAAKCNPEQFEEFHNKLQGVPRRFAAASYAQKMTDPMKALDLILQHLPEEGKCYVTKEGKQFDIDPSSIEFIIRKMDLAQSLLLFEKLPPEMVASPDRFPDLQFLFHRAFAEILKKQYDEDITKVQELIERYPFAYRFDSYSLLVDLANGNTSHLETVFKHIPTGISYDAAIGQISVPTVPKEEFTDGTQYTPTIADYQAFFPKLDQLSALARTSESIQSRDLLNRIEQARSTATKWNHILEQERDSKSLLFKIGCALALFMGIVIISFIKHRRKAQHT